LAQTDLIQSSFDYNKMF